MIKCNDVQIKRHIEAILQHHPNATSQEIRQRLMLKIKLSSIYPHFVPFYEQERIDDSIDIQRSIAKMMGEFLSFSLIAKNLSNKGYNFLQVERALIMLYSTFDSSEQIKRCKMKRFGPKQPKDEHHQAQMVMYLQRKGHQLPNILEVLRR